MYRTIDDFITDWKSEREMTAKVFDTLTDASLAQKVYPGGRTLGFIAWHLVLSLVEMGNKSGLGVMGPSEDAPEPSRAAEIAAAYRTAAASLSDRVKAVWTDKDCLEDINLYGEPWKKGYLLAVIIRHEAHHRGQMTVLMRQAGLKVPGVCGPSREEWAQYGMPEQK